MKKKGLKSILALTTFALSSLFSMDALAGTYPVTHATLNSNGSYVWDMSSDVKLYLSDLKNLQADYSTFSDYIAAEKTTLDAAITSKQSEVTSGKSTIVNKMANNCYVPAANVDTNHNNIYEWSEITNGVTLCYNKGKEKGAGCVADAIQSKGIYEDINSCSGNSDASRSWTNSFGCAAYVKVSCGAGDTNNEAIAGIYNASGTIISYNAQDDDGDKWSESYSRAQAAYNSGAVPAIFTRNVSGGTVYCYYEAGKHGGNNRMSASVSGIVPAGGSARIYVDGTHGSGDNGQNSWSIVAIPLGYN